MLSANTVFSKYENDFNKEFIIHARCVVNGEFLSTDNYEQLISTYFPELRAEILKMILFDFIIQQDDRHMSNWGVLIDSQDCRRMYKLYDNGRSLFHESDAEMVTDALADPIAYSNSFGLVGTYYDVVTDIVKYNNIHELLNLNVTEEMVRACFDGFEKYPDWKREGCVAWVMWAINTLKSLGTPTGLTGNPYSS